jgi:tetratricopeptide (TPR) repeat protein
MDNAKDAAQIRPLIPPPGCTLLVTSRQHFALPGLQANNLETLPPPDAKDLLLRIAPRIDGEADTIARLCGYLPQALQLAASAISMRVNLEPQDYARQLGDEKKRLELLAGDDESIEVLRQHPRERVRWCEEALKAARQLKNRAAEGRHLGNLGIAYFDLGDQRRAIECQEESMAIARELDDRLGEGTALGNLGLAYKNLGDYRRAIGYYEQHLSIAREIGHRQGEAHALGNLGNAYYLLGEARRALEYHTQALVVDRAIGRWRGEGDVLWNMSEVLDKLGNRKKAIEHAEASLEIREQIKDPGAEEVRKQLDIWKNG